MTLYSLLDDNSNIHAQSHMVCVFELNDSIVCIFEDVCPWKIPNLIVFAFYSFTSFTRVEEPKL